MQNMGMSKFHGEEDRESLLDLAQRNALAGDYSDSLDILERILDANAEDVGALRLKGNVLELRCFDFGGDADLKYAADFCCAKACYEKILLINPDHLGALCDLGDHYKNTGNNAEAIKYFDLVASKYSTSDCLEYQEAFFDAMESKIEMLRDSGQLTLSKVLEAELSALKCGFCSDTTILFGKPLAE